MKNKKSRAYIALVVGVVSGSFSSPLLRYVIQSGVSEQAATFYRILFAALALAPYELLVRAKRRELASCVRQKNVMLRLCGLGVLKAGTLVTQALSLKHLEAFSFNTIYYLNPLVVMVLSFFLLHEKTPFSGIVAALVSVGGVVFATLGRMQPAGVFYAALSALFYAGYIVLSRTLRAALSASVSVFIPMCISAVAMYGYAALQGVELRGFGWPGWGLLLVLGLVCTLLSQSMPVYAVGMLNSTACSLFSLFSLALAAGIGYLMLGELPTVRMLVGAGVMCAGLTAYLVMDSRYQAKRQEGCISTQRKYAQK